METLNLSSECCLDGSRVSGFGQWKSILRDLEFPAASSEVDASEDSFM